MNYLTLDNVISKRRCTEEKGWHNWRGNLNPSQRRALTDLFGTGCHQQTKARLRACFEDNCRRVKSYGIIRRIQLSRTGASYCAGQDYPSEIRTCREILIASY